MKLSSLALIGAVSSRAIASVDSGNEQFVKFSFDKHTGESFETSEQGSLLYKRADGYESIDIKNQQTFYSVELDIGTPSQKVTVLVDTGSSDIWVTNSNNPFCSGNSNKEFMVKRATAGEDNSDDFGFGGLSFTTIELTGGASDFNFMSILSEINPFGGHSTDAPVVTATRTNGGSSGQAANTVVAQPTMNCNTYGTFTPGKSSTYKSNDSFFEISYGDLSYASGTWGMDVLNINGLNVSGVSFAVANYTNSTVGVMGIGLPGLESTYVNSQSSGPQPYQYANLPMILKQSGAIKRTVYSLYLDDADAKQGSVLFGAVDHSKYSGNLFTVPLVNIYKDHGYSEAVEFDVTLYGLGVSSSTANTTIATMKLPALLDSGTTISYFPKEIVSLIASYFNAEYDETYGLYSAPCDSIDQDADMVFDFGGFHISGAVTDFFISYGKTCGLVIQPQDSEYAVLGDIFLNNAYVVYDLENLEVSMGQANYDNSNENIDVVSGSAIPSAVKAASYDNPWSTSAVVRSGGNIFTVSGNASYVPGTSATTSARSSSRTTLSSSKTSTKDQNKKNEGSLKSASLFATIASFILSYLL